ncbi:MAG: hypothetical protein FJ202_06910 [Gemmatimonadetes bacterium]|nr:hypothetical protein [Gemmatimonadota bacterium]
MLRQLVGKQTLSCFTGFGVAAAIALAGLSVTADSAAAQQTAGKGFLFGAPSISVSIRGGYSRPNAGSDVFSFVTEQLTLNKGDFASQSMGGDFSVRLRPQLDLIFSVDADGMSRKSEFREWEDADGNPIEQRTSFSRTAVGIGAKYYLRPYGRTLSRLAWVPTQYAPWLSATMGKTLYKFKQDGDFIDFDKNSRVFRDTFKSEDWGSSASIAGGVDWNVNQRVALTSQVRYLMGKSDLGSDFSGFDRIDLSGVGLSAGVVFRF